MNNVLAEYNRGKSVSIGFLFPQDYNSERVENISVTIGNKEYPHTFEFPLVSIKIPSKDTYNLSGTSNVAITIQDSILGTVPIHCGVIRFTSIVNKIANKSVNEVSDIFVYLKIDQTQISVDAVFYDIMKGDKGDAGTIEVGEVTTGDAGTDVFVENVGTSSEAVLNFTIPRGDAVYTPYIGVNGNWFINGVDTGVQAEGDATEAWVAQNYLSKLDFVGEFEPVRDKLAGIEDNANNYVHPATHPPAIIEQDANNRFVTDAEKSTWNGKITRRCNLQGAANWRVWTCNAQTAQLHTSPIV